MRLAWIAWLVAEVALMALIGFLCWHFNSGWYVLLILFGYGLKTDSKEKEAK